MIHERHTATVSFLFNHCTGGSLGTHEQNLAAVSRYLLQITHGVIEEGKGLFQVDDMDVAPRTKNVRGHLRIPITRLVAEVNTGFQHLTHRYIRHFYS